MIAYGAAEHGPWLPRGMDRKIKWNGLGWRGVRMSITSWKNWRRSSKKAARQAVRREIEAAK